MTLRIRNRLLKFILFSGVFLPALSVYNFVVFLLYRENFEYRFTAFSDMISVIVFYVFLFVLSALIYLFVLLTYYRFRTIMSNEIFFHLLSLYVLLFINLKSFFMNYSILELPDSFFVYGMRIFYAVILLVPLYSFCGAFFSLGVENNRFDIIFYVLLVGFALLSVLIPIDSQTVGRGIYYRSYVLIYIYIIFIFLELLTMIIYLADRKINTFRDNLVLMLSSLVFSFSFLLLYIVNLIYVLTLLTVIYFTAYYIYAKKLYRIYLWR